MPTEYDGYPPSDPDDLTPPPGAAVLEFGDPDVVDRQLDAQGRVYKPDGAEPEGTADLEEERSDQHDVDDLMVAPNPAVHGGRVEPTDSPNFNDNLARWSRETNRHG